MAEENEDWLFPNAREQQTQIAQQGLEFARRYLVFTRDPDAAAILEQWTTQVRKKPLSAGASLQEYAAANAIREFVEGLHAQIDFATKGLNLPTSRTK